jgi:hypothetical protein
MWLSVLVGLIMVPLSLFVSYGDWMSRDVPVDSRESRLIVDQYRTFAYLAHLYLSAHPEAVAQTLDWEVLRSDGITPPALRNATFPAGWKVVVGADGSHVLCTPMPEKAMSAIRQLMPQTVRLIGVAGPDGDQRYVLAATQAEAEQEALKCGE